MSYEALKGIELDTSDSFGITIIRIATSTIILGSIVGTFIGLMKGAI